MPKEEYVKVCPKCGSDDISTDFSNPVVWDSGATPNYQCKSCGHLAKIFPEVEKKEIDLFRNELKKKIHKSEFKNDPVVDAKTGFNVGMAELILAAAIITTILIIFFILKYFR